MQVTCVCKGVRAFPAKSMLDKDRVILMTRMASYEEVRFFKGDYIAVGILKAIICASISFALILALYVYYNFDVFMSSIYDMDILAFVRSILTKYAWFVGIYVMITYVVCTITYNSSRRKLKRYYRNLRVLKKMYDRQ